MSIEDLFLANFSRADPQTEPEVQELITEAETMLQKLKDEALGIITRPNPIKWAPFISWFNTELHRVINAILQRLGVNMIIPPIEYPDGITSTSELTQSEMVQFVTNTLDTWQGTLLGLIDQYTGDQAELIRQLQRRIAELEEQLANIKPLYDITTVLTYKPKAKITVSLNYNGIAPLYNITTVLTKKPAKHLVVTLPYDFGLYDISTNIYKEV